jgi:predicted O-linked N-acetylglucosamine transferase (SPINDLY family)
MKPKAPTPKQIALFQQANSLHQAGQLAEALAVFKKLLPDFGKDPELLERIGAITLQQGHPQQALPFFERSLQMAPQKALTHCNRGIALQQLQRLDQALAAYNQALSLKPDYAEAYINRGIVFYSLERYSDAIADYQRALELNPNQALAWNYRGLASMKLQQTEQALGDYQAAISLNPHYAEAYDNRGVSLHALNRLEEALRSHEQAIALNPAYAVAWFNKGNVLQDMKMLEAAVDSFETAIKLGLATAGVYINQGIVCQELKRDEAALLCFDQAIAHDPGSAAAYLNKAVLLQNLKRLDESLANFSAAKQIDADYEFVCGQVVFNKLQICDWDNLESELAELTAKIGQGLQAAMPWHVLSFTDELHWQQQAAAIWMQQKFPPASSPETLAISLGHDKIRIGYFSADFYTHPVAVLAVGVFENHDRSRFEITGFYDGNRHDAMTDRLKAAFDRFIDISQLSDPQVVELARNLEIDIAVDLAGYTGDSRTGVFARRLAPLQVSYLGYAGTMAADYIDYMFADRVLIPESSRAYYTENMAFLPNSFQANDNTRAIADTGFTRQQFGLPEKAFVYCCFNNSYKITPDMFQRWLRILAAVTNSVLWLPVDNATATANLKAAAAATGIDPERLIFAPRMDRPEDHLARLKLADLFLDTSPYNAHTTASDALWAGLPLLTWPGASYASRVSASLLSALQLPELIVASAVDYEALAIELALKPEKLATIRARLQQHRLTTPLFDTGLFTGHLEAAFSEMYSLRVAGKSAVDFDVKP